MIALFSMAGCAHSLAPLTRFAEGGVTLCRHCNCYMPAYLPDDAACPACNCGYAVIGCQHGTKGNYAKHVDLAAGD